jgi:hypothetical protein
MDSVLSESTGKMEPSDAQRVAQISAELGKIFERLKTFVEKRKEAK